MKNKNRAMNISNDTRKIVIAIENIHAESPPSIKEMKKVNTEILNQGIP